MFFLTVGKELVHNILSFRFVVTYALLFCLILMAMFLMTNDYQSRLQEYSTEDGKVREKLAELMKIEDPAEQFQRVRRADFSALRRPTPLSLLALGLEGSLPTQVSSQSRFFVSASDDRLGRNVLCDIFQTPDFVYGVNIVMSLLALLFVFDSVCGEKERGPSSSFSPTPFPGIPSSSASGSAGFSRSQLPSPLPCWEDLPTSTSPAQWK